MVVKPRKAIANADYLSKLKGPDQYWTSLATNFPNEFLDLDVQSSLPLVKTEIVTAMFHVEGEAVSEFQDIINYLVNQEYPNGLSLEEKIIFSIESGSLYSDS